MEHYLLIARSVTHAQRMERTLGQYGIRTRIFRAPTALTDRGCAYAVQIPADRFPAAMSALRQAQLTPVSIYFHRENGYVEVTP